MSIYPEGVLNCVQYRVAGQHLVEGTWEPQVEGVVGYGEKRGKGGVARGRRMRKRRVRDHVMRQNLASSYLGHADTTHAT